MNGLCNTTSATLVQEDQALQHLREFSWFRTPRYTWSAEDCPVFAEKQLGIPSMEDVLHTTPTSVSSDTINSSRSARLTLTTRWPPRDPYCIRSMVSMSSPPSTRRLRW